MVKKIIGFLLFFFMVAFPAHAYVGPGLGMGVIGVIFGIIGSIFIALFAVFWYPIKRIIKKIKKGKKGSNDPTMDKNGS